MQKITTHLWFDKEAKEAAQFYISAFGDSKILNSNELHDTPSGNVDLISVNLLGQDFSLISAGPFFKFTKSISFHVACKTPQEVDKIWEKISVGGKVLMELGAYPFSERYGWIEDKFGLSWQIICMGDRMPTQRITPILMFSGNVTGKAEEATNFYTNVFHDAKVLYKLPYSKGEEPDIEGTIKYMSFTLENITFGAMDSARVHDSAFNEAISFIVNCETQEEIDYYWNKLTAVPESEQCGWLKDKYGVSWQIVPTLMGKMFSEGNPKQVEKVTEAFLKMKKFNIAELTKVYEENK